MSDEQKVTGVSFETPVEQKVIVGRIVHHIYNDECVAAIITRVFEPAEGKPNIGAVGVTIFPWSDGVDAIDSYECQEKPIPGTWHWPQGCPNG